MSADPLELPATPQRVRAIRRSAALPPHLLNRALALAVATPDERAWHRFLSLALALLGAGLVLAGVASFIAYNWLHVGRFAKFGGIELAICAATIVGWRTLPRVSGRIALASAAVLVGPLLAVYGQTYETGADPYGLFLGWLALIVPWVIAAEFAPLWLFALFLLDISVTLYWSQAIQTGYGSDGANLVVGGIHALALVAWELQRRLTDRRAPRLIAVTGFGALLASASYIVMSDNRDPINVLALIVLIVAIVSALLRYRRVRPDRFMVTIAVATAMAWMTIAIGHIVFTSLDFGTASSLIMTALVLAEIVLGLRWYRAFSSTLS
ncbi:MAG: DUF2157 domain-containing protein [bacterium]